MSVVAWAVVALGLGYGFLNGMNDSGSLAAAMICTGAVRPRRALLLMAAWLLTIPVTGGLAGILYWLAVRHL